LEQRDGGIEHPFAVGRGLFGADRLLIGAGRCFHVMDNDTNSNFMSTRMTSK
jgi:hypothetical protein